WQESMKDDSITQVDVRAIRPNAKRTGSDAISAAAAEVGKYSTKPSDYVRKADTPTGYKADNPVVMTLDSALHNRRLLAFGGILREIRAELKQQDVETADLVHVDGEQTNICICSVCASPMWNHVYRWAPGLNNYVG
ncbi:MAG: protein rep, partial [bacterium]|nr:protein rep [bacterium]